MGLIRRVEVLPTGAGDHQVVVHLRLTAPGCLYWLYFERELQTRAEFADVLTPTRGF